MLDWERDEGRINIANGCHYGTNVMTEGRFYFECVVVGGKGLDSTQVGFSSSSHVGEVFGVLNSGRFQFTWEPARGLIRTFCKNKSSFAKMGRANKITAGTRLGILWDAGTGDIQLYRNRKLFGEWKLDLVTATTPEYLAAAEKRKKLKERMRKQGATFSAPTRLEDMMEEDNMVVAHGPLIRHYLQCVDGVMSVL